MASKNCYGLDKVGDRLCYHIVVSVLDKGKKRRLHFILLSCLRYKDFF